MATAAAYKFNSFSRHSYSAYNREKAQKSRRFNGTSTSGHCIKDCVLIDPACGSGNFLTETYISLRRLENDTLKAIHRGQMMLGGEGEFNPIKVSIGQFYGIEINDFAVTVAKTALWIAESQMMHETEEIVQQDLDFLPLKSYANITEGNALRIDWESVVDKDKLNFIMGNPPFVGYSLQSKSQKNDILSVYKDEKGKSYKTAGKIDYVSAWYFKAAQLMQETSVRTAFVSTNLSLRVNRLQAFGNRCLTVLTFTVTLHIARFVGTVKQA